MPIMPIIKKAICYGFVAKTIKKIEELNSFIQLYPKSNYRDDAMYELANTYVASGKQDLALKTFDRLISEFKTDLTLQNQFCVKG
jgi:predicted negative regulator of RcsB-dependent stress response